MFPSPTKPGQDHLRMEEFYVRGERAEAHGGIDAHFGAAVKPGQRTRQHRSRMRGSLARLSRTAGIPGNRTNAPVFTGSFHTATI